MLAPPPLKLLGGGAGPPAPPPLATPMWNRKNFWLLSHMFVFLLISGDYLTNSCEGKGPDCLPCVERFSSCVGLPDGNNSYGGLLMTERYITCLQERTVGEGVCEKGYYFAPIRKICTRRLDSGWCQSCGQIQVGAQC